MLSCQPGGAARPSRRSITGTMSVSFMPRKHRSGLLRRHRPAERGERRRPPPGCATGSLSTSTPSQSKITSRKRCRAPRITSCAPQRERTRSRRIGPGERTIAVRRRAGPSADWLHSPGPYATHPAHQRGQGGDEPGVGICGGGAEIPRHPSLVGKIAVLDVEFHQRLGMLGDEGDRHHQHRYLVARRPARSPPRWTGRSISAGSRATGSRCCNPAR